MSAIKTIRERLKLTQTDFGIALGVSQGSISFYEQGSIPIPPQTAAKLIEFAKSHGIKVSFNDLYAESARA